MRCSRGRDEVCVCVTLSNARVMARGEWVSGKKNEMGNTRKAFVGGMGKMGKRLNWK